MNASEGRAHGPLTDTEVDQLRRHLLVGRPAGTVVTIDQRTGRWRRTIPSRRAG